MENPSLLEKTLSTQKKGMKLDTAVCPYEIIETDKNEEKKTEESTSNCEEEITFNNVSSSHGTFSGFF